MSEPRCSCGARIEGNLIRMGREEQPAIGELGLCLSCAQAFLFAGQGLIFVVEWDLVRWMLSERPKCLAEFSDRREQILLSKRWNKATETETHAKCRFCKADVWISRSPRLLAHVDPPCEPFNALCVTQPFETAIALGTESCACETCKPFAVAVTAPGGNA